MTTASAPGKIILFGEHAVVYGEPAIGLALSRKVTVSIEPGRGRVRVYGARVRGSKNAATPKELVVAALGKRALEKLDVEIELDVPPMSGLGSSAALAVALLRAAGFDGDVLEEAIRIENVAHGKSSGVDPAICAAGGLIAYEQKQVTPIRPGASLFLVVGARSAHGGTRATVGGMAELRGRAPALVTPAMAALGACAREGRRSIERGDLELVGRSMDLAHGILSGLGIVAPATEEIVRAARKAGALGAKMSGAGGKGGAFVALAPNARAAHRIAKAVEGWVEEVTA